MDTRNTHIARLVMEAFEHRRGIFNSSANAVMDKAIKMLRKKLQETTNPEFEKECDIIIVGTLIYVFMLEDKRYPHQQLFGNMPLYRLNFNNISMKVGETDEQYIIRCGTLALIDKSIPFVFNEMPKNAFPELTDVNYGIPPDYFDCYGLNPNFRMRESGDTPEEERKRGKDRKDERERNANNKWGKPFGWPQQNVWSEAEEQPDFSERRAQAESAFNEQTSQKNPPWKWTRRFFVFLSALFPFSLCFTIPWILKKEKAEKEALLAEPLQKLTFTKDEFESVKSQRALFNSYWRAFLKWKQKKINSKKSV